MIKLLIHFIYNKELKSGGLTTITTHNMTGEKIVKVELPIGRIIYEDGNYVKPDMISLINSIEYTLNDYSLTYKTINFVDTLLVLTGVIIDTVPNHDSTITKYASTLKESIDAIANYSVNEISDQGTTVSTFSIRTKYYELPISIDHSNDEKIVVALTRPRGMYFVYDRIMSLLCGLSVYRQYNDPKELFVDVSTVKWIEHALIQNNYNSYRPTSSNIIAVRIDNNPFKVGDKANLIDRNTDKCIGTLLYHSDKMLLLSVNNNININTIDFSRSDIIVDMGNEIKRIFTVDLPTRENYITWHNFITSLREELGDDDLVICTEYRNGISRQECSHSTQATEAKDNQENQQDDKDMILLVMRYFKDGLEMLEALYNKQYNHTKELTTEKDGENNNETK